jgi:hypothetical protein
MYKTKSLIIVFSILLLFYNQIVLAFDEELSVRATMDGNYEVFGQGLELECTVLKLDPNPQVIMNGFTIQINGRFTTPTECITNNPPQVYSVVISLGKLRPGTYNLTWHQPPVLTETIQFNVAAVPIPALSIEALICLFVLLFGASVHITKKSS